VASDLTVLRELAVRLGQPSSRFPDSPEAVFAELGRASAGGPADYAGISYQRLRDGEALHWPCPDRDHPGTPRLFLDRFAHPDRRAKFAPVDHRGPAEPTDPAYPLIATTGRTLVHYQSGAQTRRVDELNRVAAAGYAEIHPDTALRAGLADGDRARIISRRGTVEVDVRCVPTIRPDTVFLPFHFPGAERANLVTNPALDPTSRMPELKTCAVRLVPTGGRRS
jgi:assimilatory nitrate reductase catalytic subunit